MARQRRDRPRTRAGLVAYLAVCALLVSGSWVVSGRVLAASESPTPGPTATQVATATPADPTASPTPQPTASPSPSPSSSAYPVPDTEEPFFQVDYYRDGIFVSQLTKESCMAGAVQNMLNIVTRKVDTSVARQNEISTALIANTTKEDSLNGGYGPEGWAITLTQFGAGRYKLLIDSSLNQALHDAVTALRRTGRPVGLLSWWGAHSWVMTGFRADVDPRKAPNTFKVLGAFIVDPFYPRHSSIWGQTMGPDSYRNMADLVHNYIGWKRPEGHYPGRDGKWLLVVPY